MICKTCRQTIEEGDLCDRCFEIKIANEYAQGIIPFLLEHNIEFSKKDFGDASGFYLDLGDGITLNFHHAGRVAFEYDEELKNKIEEIEKEVFV